MHDPHLSLYVTVAALVPQHIEGEFLALGAVAGLLAFANSGVS